MVAKTKNSRYGKPGNKTNNKTGNKTDKRYDNKAAIALVVSATFFLAVGQFFQKLGLNKLHEALIHGVITTLIGFGFYSLAFLIVVIAMSKADLSMVYPFIGLAFVWVAILSTLFLGEVVTLTRWIGIASIIIGLIFIARS